MDLTATPMAAVAPSWLVRFKRKGRFAKRVHEEAA